ncbi:MAG: monofunctional biosynthetic peptidoglycan transglycosylase [Elusimicrobiota bacterium]|jgi:monofunctional biosynthetic peptidoglycan transglycosylase
MTGKTLSFCGLSMAFCTALILAYRMWLPDVAPLRVENPRSTKYVEIYVRRMLAHGGSPAVSMRWVPLEDLSPYLRAAVLVAEDDRFYAHRGVDWKEIHRAVRYNIRRRRMARGASTITQQVARNLFLSPRRTTWRKLQEILIARHLERSIEKDRILEIYLNVVEWGEGIFGAEAASQAYFGKHASELGPAEAVALVVALPSPYRLNPDQAPDELTRKKIVLYLDRMRRERHFPAPSAESVQ